jgi:small conductance mechanosensitive channel
MEPPLRSLVARLVKLLVIGVAVVMALGTAGANIAALVAGIGVAGVGIGLAMQGMLSNIVAGLTIIFTKPFRVGEYVELLGVHGQVETIELFNTTLQHPDRSRVVIPNRKIIGEILHNYGTIRQLDLAVAVAYNTDLPGALAAVRAVLEANPRVLKEHPPVVGISVLADSSIHIAVKPWVKVPDYGPASAELNQAIVERFRQSKITIPFPQREVRMLNA